MALISPNGCRTDHDDPVNGRAGNPGVIYNSVTKKLGECMSAPHSGDIPLCQPQVRQIL